MNKIKTFIASRTKYDWINIAMWLVTFGLLFAVVGVVAAIGTQDSFTTSQSNEIAAVATVFGIFLMASVLTTAIIQYIKKNKGGAK